MLSGGQARTTPHNSAFSEGLYFIIRHEVALLMIISPVRDACQTNIAYYTSSHGQVVEESFDFGLLSTGIC